MKRNLLKSLVMTAAVLVGMNGAVAQQPHVYINPGHGGHESDDRNVVVAPFAQGDTAGFWESNASLWKGFALQEVLKKKGYKTSISRVTNDENSDLNLSTIVALCNASGADIFYAIHSNATGAGDNYRINFPLGLYRGYTGQPQVAGSDKLASDLGVYLIANQSTVWTNNNYAIYGDWTFYPSWGLQGLGVLRGNNVVSMLDEGSFHDYIPETYRLINRDYCWVEGWNFSLGADRYFGRLDQYDLGIITGNLRDDRLLRDATYVMHGADVRQPINNATVRLLDANGNVVQTTTTDNIQNGIYLFKYVAPGTYTVEVSEAEHFGQSKEVTVAANAPTYCNFDLKRVRNTPPEVVSYSPVWASGDAPVKCVEPIVLQFNWDMDIASTEAAFTITPHVDGKITWEDTNYRMIFTPDDAYDVNTLYTVTLKKSAQHGGGTEMERDFTMQFTTQGRNHLNTLALWPREGCKVHFKTVNSEFRTDSLLQSKDLFNLFRIKDKDATEQAWNKRSIKNNKSGDAYGYIRLPLTKDLVAGDDYVLEIDREVSDTAGIHLPAAQVIHFKAVDIGSEKPGSVVLFDGESADGAAVTGNYASAALSTSTTRLLGSKSLQLKYDFTGVTNEAQAVINLSELPQQGFARGDTLGVHVWGDMSCNALKVVLAPADDSAIAPIEMDLGNIDFHGWQYLTCVPSNGGNYRLTGFKLSHDTEGSRAKMGVSGTLLIDDVLYQKTSGESGIGHVALAGVKVMPNPASDYLVASADGLIQGVELYDMAGALVARHAGNYINVSDITSGVYAFKVYVNGLISTHKVVVSH